MIKKTISAACAVLLTLASASCQKSDVDLCLDAQTELVETLQKINDRDSADKHADEVDDLANQFFKLHDSISDTPEEKKLEDNPQYEKSSKQLEALGMQLFFKGYYGSEKLRNALGRK